MNLSRVREALKKDGWLYAALIGCVGLCLLLSGRGDEVNREEQRIGEVLSQVSGAGSVHVAVHWENALPCGAVVVAEGADDLAVRLRLEKAVTSLLGIEEDRIAVYPMEGGRP